MCAHRLLNSKGIEKWGGSDMFFLNKNYIQIPLETKIGYGFYIGPNICIVEDVLIKDNVTIGAGSVVCKNLPENATVAGNYAKVLNFNNPGRYIENRWNIDS